MVILDCYPNIYIILTLPHSDTSSLSFQLLGKEFLELFGFSLYMFVSQAISWLWYTYILYRLSLLTSHTAFVWLYGCNLINMFCIHLLFCKYYICCTRYTGFLKKIVPSKHVKPVSTCNRLFFMHDISYLQCLFMYCIVWIFHVYNIFFKSYTLSINLFYYIPVPASSHFS